MDLQDLVQNLELDALRRLALELFRRQPAVFADLVNGEMVQHIQHPPDVEMATQPQHEPTPAVHEGDQQPAPSPPSTQDGSTDWCKCVAGAKICPPHWKIDVVGFCCFYIV